LVGEEEGDDSENEEDLIKVYHCVENTREYQALEPRFFVINSYEVDAMEDLIHNYPRYTEIGNLPLDSDKEKVSVYSIKQ
jgi:hypothetical protein